MAGMSEPLGSRQKPRDHAALSDLTLIVRPPGRPQDIRAFTDGERAEAELCATQSGATVEPLP